MIATLPQPFSAPAGVRFKDFPIPAGSRLIAGWYGGKFGYRVIRKHIATPPRAA